MTMTSLTLILASLSFGCSSIDVLENTTSIEISQSWSQMPSGWVYPISISVPESSPPEEGFPVCILLHGNGSSGPPMISQLRSVLPDHALVAPSGYANSWNICAESSDAPDWEMIRELVDQLGTFSNVNADRIQMLGISNGAALVNTIFTLQPPVAVEAYVAVVSHLNESQYHDNSFHSPDSQTNPGLPWCGYTNATVPALSRRYLSMSNVNDGIIPYEGGSSPVGVTFLSATDAIYRIAQSQGFNGDALSGPQPQVPGEPIWEYVYLEGQVTHLRGVAQHGMSPGHEAYAEEFLSRPPITRCVGDEDGNGEVGFPDLTLILSSWGPDIGFDELLQVLGNWGACL